MVSDTSGTDQDARIKGQMKSSPVLVRRGLNMGLGLGPTRKPEMPHVLDDPLNVSTGPAGERLNNCEGDGEGG